MASSEPYMGSCDFTAFNFAINGWALANGAFLPINQNTALFSLLGTYWGGNGTTTFALPDLRGRAPVGQGQGPGLTPRVMGQAYGQEAVTLTTGNMPPHVHQVQLGGADSTDNTSGPAVQGTTSSTGAATVPSSPTGGGQPVATQPPSLVMCAQVALYGLYPPRD
jgi:microcystin-dependent protein